MSAVDRSPACSGLGDLLSQGSSLLSPIEVPPVRYVWMALNIFDRCTSLADQRYLTMALGLDAPLPEPRRDPGAQAFPMLAHMPARSTKGKRRKS